MASWRTDRRGGGPIVAASAISAAGLVTHNIADLPGQTPLSPESLYPTLVTLALVLAWFTPARRAATWALLAWGVLNLVGGAVLSVLPLPILPFDPEQSVRHYAFHLLYAASQVPLIVVAIRWLRLHPAHSRVPPPA